MNGVREISNAGRKKLDFAEIDQCKPVLLGLSLAGNLVKPLLSLYGPNGGSVATDSYDIRSDLAIALYFTV